ncbi:hypothetical protein DSC45_20975 [Streptomyces sp. YIM 130001]|nr:hypothetical protein DSC45_20975 [Streptomyces sp. YIM 130001]
MPASTGTGPADFYFTHEESDAAWWPRPRLKLHGGAAAPGPRRLRPARQSASVRLPAMRPAEHGLPILHLPRHSGARGTSSTPAPDLYARWWSAHLTEGLHSETRTRCSPQAPGCGTRRVSRHHALVDDGPDAVSDHRRRGGEPYPRVHVRTPPAGEWLPVEPRRVWPGRDRLRPCLAATARSAGRPCGAGRTSTCTGPPRAHGSVAALRMPDVTGTVLGRRAPLPVAAASPRRRDGWEAAG